jgi:hypothetical protein
MSKPTMRSPGVGAAWLRERFDADDTDDCIFLDIPGGIWIGRGGRVERMYVVVCVWEHGPRPEGMQAAHSCGNGPGCVNRRHLRWATASENEQDKIIHGTSNRGERHGNAKLTEADVRAIRTDDRRPYHLIALDYGVNDWTIARIIRRESWAWLG